MGKTNVIYDMLYGSTEMPHDMRYGITDMLYEMLCGETDTLYEVVYERTDMLYDMAYGKSCKTFIIFLSSQVDVLQPNNGLARWMYSSRSVPVVNIESVNARRPSVLTSSLQFRSTLSCF